MVAVGHLTSYAIGSIDMVSIFGTMLGDTQFKQMTVISGVSLIGTVLITCYAVQERILVSTRFVVRRRQLLPSTY
jgi:solute carrier family 45, member 1/2/4